MIQETACSLAKRSPRRKLRDGGSFLECLANSPKTFSTRLLHLPPPPLIYCLLFVASPRLYAELFRSASETIRVKAAPVAGSGGYLRVEEQAAVCASRRIKNRGVFGLNASHCGTLLRAAVSETRTREREREREGFLWQLGENNGRKNILACWIPCANALGYVGIAGNRRLLVEEDSRTATIFIVDDAMLLSVISVDVTLWKTRNNWNFVER